MSEYFLAPGYIFLSRDPVRVKTVLGSCVSVFLYDERNHYSGMNHYMLPEFDPLGGKKPTAVYGNVSLTYLVRLMLDEGSRITDLVAHVAGGGVKTGIDASLRIASDNARVAEAFLEKRNIRLLSSDTGGEVSRRVVFDSGTNVLGIETLGQETFREYCRTTCERRFDCATNSCTRGR